MEPEFVNESMWDDDDDGTNNDETNFGEDDSNMEMTGFDGSTTGDGNLTGGGEGGAVGDAQEFLSCPVCGDVANGIHYGIYTCESCKSFFKRGVAQQKSYSCSKLTNTCIITPNTRTRCPSCRFMKCKLVGMKTELVRMSRERGGRGTVKNEQGWKGSPNLGMYSLKDMNP